MSKLASNNSLDSTECTLDDLEAENEVLRLTNEKLVHALTEIQVDLREAIEERRAFELTVKQLSESLCQSDLRYWEVAKLAEDLELKLQAVSFVDVRRGASQDEDKAEEQRAKTSKKKKKKSSSPGTKEKKKNSLAAKKIKESVVGVKNAESTEEAVEDKNDDEVDIKAFKEAAIVSDIEESEPETSSSEADSEGEAFESEPVPAEDIEWKRATSSHTKNTSTTNDAPKKKKTVIVKKPKKKAKKNACPFSGFEIAPNGLPTPSQAAFYHIIADRDASSRQVTFLRKQLSHVNEERKDLANRLQKYQALVELSYATSQQSSGPVDMEDDATCSSQQTAKVSNSQRRKNNMRWLLKGKRHGSEHSVVQPQSSPSDWSLQDVMAPDVLPDNFFAGFTDCEVKRLEL